MKVLKNVNNHINCVIRVSCILQQHLALPGTVKDLILYKAHFSQKRKCFDHLFLKLFSVVCAFFYLIWQGSDLFCFTKNIGFASYAKRFCIKILWLFFYRIWRKHTCELIYTNVQKYEICWKFHDYFSVQMKSIKLVGNPVLLTKFLSLAHSFPESRLYNQAYRCFSLSTKLSLLL